jgi:p-aminobenzoyl-glutamate transporter AbgT
MSQGVGSLRRAPAQLAERVLGPVANMLHASLRVMPISGARVAFAGVQGQ